MRMGNWVKKFAPWSPQFVQVRPEFRSDVGALATRRLTAAAPSQELKLTYGP